MAPLTSETIPIPRAGLLHLVILYIVILENCNSDGIKASEIKAMTKISTKCCQV